MKRLIMFIMLIFSVNLFSQVILEVDSTNISMGQPFYLQAKFINESKKDFKILGMENFSIISQGTNSSYSIINGKKSTSIGITYALIPKSIGNYKLTLKTKDSVSNTVNINVKKEIISSQTENINFTANLNNKNTYYFGEHIPYQENFKTTVKIGSLDYVDLPNLSAFSVKDLNNKNMQPTYFQTKDGRQGIDYTTYTGILMPNSSGEKEITKGRIAYTLNTYNDFFYRERPKYLGGEKIKINILPLPNNAPNDFQNVVGAPKISYNYNKSMVNYGESILLNLEISGDVNLDNLDKIITNNLDDFNVFETLKDSTEGIESGHYFAKKVFEIALIPKSTGKIIIPEIKIPYFNVKTKKYDNLIIPSKKIIVNANGASKIEENNITPKKDLEEIKIVSLENNKNINNLKLNYIIYLLLFVSIAELIIIIYLIKNKKIKEKYDLSDLKNSKNINEFYERYCNFMKNNFNFSPKAHLDEKLKDLGFDDEFIALNDEISMAYYDKKELNYKEITNKMKKYLK